MTKWPYLLAVLVALGLAAPQTRALFFGNKPEDPKVAYERDVKPVFEKYCSSCHGGGKHKGDLDLDQYKEFPKALTELKVWQYVQQNIRTHEMPPEGKAQPTDAERLKVINWVDSHVFKVDPKNPDPGRVTLRRLNKVEYNNTIRDLLEVDFKPAADFPADDVGYGFDNIGDVLSVPPVLIEKYLAAAEKILDEAIVLDGPIKGGEAKRIEAETLPTTSKDSRPYGGWAFGLMKEGEIYTTIKIEKPGSYFLRARAFGQQAGPEAPKLDLALDGKSLSVFPVEAVEKAPQVYQIEAQLTPGEHRLSAGYLNNYVTKQGDRNLIIDYLEVVGPLVEQPYPASHRHIFTKSLLPADRDGFAREILTRFAKRAWRRSVEKQEVERLMAFYKSAGAEGDSFERAVRSAMTVVLVSPHFLFRGELQPEPDNPHSIHEVSEFAMASRLSYFLWSSMPDDELFAMAEKKALRKNLQTQVRRMLRDPKSKALVDNFAQQWLQIRNLNHLNPSKETYPDFDMALRKSMQGETEAFFEYIMRKDRSVLEFLDADYTFVNERLATHYGMKGVKGEEFQKVSLKGTPRGGLLTQASILTITSNPTRTSPVKRGKWVLENLLGTPPPPPPPNVPELSEAKEKVLQGSLRQRMEQHREKPICASCHARMDPIGFGIENFDGIGKWREKDGEFVIDPSGKLTTGEDFQGPADLKKILLSTKRDDFLRCLTEKLLTYALGRGIEYYDKPAVDGVLSEMAKTGFKFSTLVMEVIESTPFQKRRGDGDRLAAK